MNLEEAIDWCHENQAVVTFFYLQGLTWQPRVHVRVGGYRIAERNSLIDAVEFLSSKQQSEVKT